VQGTAARKGAALGMACDERRDDEDGGGSMMRVMRNRVLFRFVVIVFLATLVGHAQPVRARGGGPGEVAKLHALFDEQWERDLREDPIFASSLGDRRYNDRWPDLTLKAARRSHREDRRVIERLDAIDRAALPAAEQLNYDLFRIRYANAIEAYRFHEFLMPIDQQSGIQLADDLRQQVPLETEKDYQDWTVRLRAMGVQIDQTITLLERGLDEGRTPPRVILERVPEQISAQVVGDPERSPFFVPYQEIPASVPTDSKDRLRSEGRSAIAEVVVPAYRRLLNFFEDRYLPGSRSTIAASDLPDGDAYYAFLTRMHTTTDMTPEAIHRLGLGEVKRIRAEMDALIDQIGFDGTYAEFLEFLRSDDRFYYDNPDELLAGYRAIIQRIDPELPRLFGRLPTIPYEVQPIPAIAAPSATAAYYFEGTVDGSRPGTVFVNLDQPRSRPKYEMETLMAHEGVPGHHLQISLALEQGHLPNFRRHSFFTAYIEGWGLYSESLGEALGLYHDPYSKFGQLTFEMWRAVRLVVDTGMHAKGWSRQQAIDYFKENAARPEHDIVNEVDRYLAWPGQALAYKIGQLKFSELRRRAEDHLGDRFDIKEFHDLVLASGALPLDLLEGKVDRWLAAGAE
jgi:uncharacterized protein (DUF885 family)